MARKKFACDFETTTDVNDCRVWGYGIRQLYNKEYTVVGNDMNKFMFWLTGVQSDVYFHNLKFDGSFIVNWLLKNGWEFSTEGLPGTFNVLISSMGQWYSIDIVMGYRGKKKLHTVVYDSLKKLPFPIKTIANAFNLEVKKGDIDYHKYRPPGHEIDSEEREYIENDVEILAQALEIQFDQGLTRMTTGSDAMGSYKEMLTKKIFDKYYPTVPLEMDMNIRKAYRGGFTWLNKRYAGKIINGGIVLDINSMYPATMMNRELPIGMPKFFEGKYKKDDTHPLYIQRIRCSFELKPDHVPTIQIKNNPLFKSTEYLESSKGEIVELYVTNIDLDLMKAHYNLYEVEYMDGFKFKKSTGMFKDYIEKWTEVKVNNDGAIRLLAKLMLNSLYGKFASNPDVTGKVPYLKEDGSNGFKTGEEEFKDPVYTPMGIFITSWCRHQIISTAQSCYDRIIYCDTDSVHLVGNEIPEHMEPYIHPKELGKWDHEGTYVRGKYIRQKTYVHEYEKDEGVKLKVTCAGMPDSVKKQVTFDSFDKGFSAPGKLIPKQVDGGVVLVDTDYTLK